MRDAATASEPRRWRPVVFVSLAVVSAVLLPLVVVLFNLWSSAEDREDDRQSLQRVAATFADRFLTIDSGDIDRTKEQVLELSTGAFRRTYEQGLETGVLQRTLDLERVTTEATVEEVFVGDVDSRAAHVIVQAFVVARAEDGSEPRERPRSELFIELDLVEQDGDWLVDAVANLNFGAPALDQQ